MDWESMTTREKVLLYIMISTLVVVGLAAFPVVIWVISLKFFSLLGL